MGSKPTLVSMPAVKIPNAPPRTNPGKDDGYEKNLWIGAEVSSQDQNCPGPTGSTRGCPSVWWALMLTLLYFRHTARSTLPSTGEGRKETPPRAHGPEWALRTEGAAASPSAPTPPGTAGPPGSPSPAAPPTQANAALKAQLSMALSTIFCSLLLGGLGMPPKVLGSHTRGRRCSPTRCCSRALYCRGGGGCEPPGVEGGGAPAIAVLGAATRSSRRQRGFRSAEGAARGCRWVS